jgi:hypothetical protein
VQHDLGLDRKIEGDGDETRFLRQLGEPSCPRLVGSGVSPARLGQLLAFVLATVASFVLAESVVVG